MRRNVGRPTRWALRFVALSTLVVLSSCTAQLDGGVTPGDEGVVSVLSLLPTRSSADQVDVTSMNRAIEAVLEERGGMAGRFRVQVEQADSTDPSTGSEWFASCPSVATSHASDEGVVAVIGPLTDACAAGVVPVFNQVGVAVVSPAVTSPVFTHVPVGAERGGGECSLQPARFRLDGCVPASFQPTGDPSFVHVPASVDRQGVAAAAALRSLGVRRVFLATLYGSDAWMGGSFRAEAERLGIDIVAEGYPDVYEQVPSDVDAFTADVVASDPEAILFVGTQDADASGRDVGVAPYVAGLRAAGFTGPVVGSFWLSSGQLADSAVDGGEGVYTVTTRLPLEAMPVQAREFAAGLGLDGRAAVSAVYAGAAMEMIMDAIAASDGTPDSVREELLRLRTHGRAVGSGARDAGGDVVPARVAVLLVDGDAVELHSALTVGPTR